MKYYDIKKVNIDKYSIIVLSNSFENPFFYESQIERDLQGEKGYVLFDLLTVNGLSSNRFIEAFYDGEKIRADSYKIIKNVSDDILNYTREYYLNKPKIISNSAMTNIENAIYTKSKALI